jgi:KDO2-lipid IV(A) lauroyltransferase
VRLTFRAARVPIPETNDPEAYTLAATAALQKRFEAFIREAMEQWMWAHRHRD